jgi:hypothetical protein
LISSGSAITARIRIGESHLLQVNEPTSYTWEITLAQVEQLSRSDTADSS